MKTLVVVTFLDDDSETKNVTYVRGLNCNLLSIRKLAKRGYKVVFEDNRSTISKNGKTQFVTQKEICMNFN